MRSFIVFGCTLIAAAINLEVVTSGTIPILILTIGAFLMDIFEFINKIKKNKS